MPGMSKPKKIGMDFGQGFKPSKRKRLMRDDKSDFAGKQPSKKQRLMRDDKSDFAGKSPSKKQRLMRDDKSDFAGANKFKAKSTTKSSPKTFSSFGAAFKDARKRLGAGKTFTYKGKKYTTNLASDKKKVSTKTITKTPKPRPGKAKSILNLIKSSQPKKKDTKSKLLKPTIKGLDSKGFYKGTNIKPTKTQLERLKKRK